MFFPTTLVGSYSQPEWLIDRAKLAGRFPPRVRAKELWRIPERWLEEAQNDATLLAIRAHTKKAIKMTVPGPFTMSQQAQNDYYPNEEEAAMDYAVAVNVEIRDLFAAGADIVQIDEPYMQARPEKARQYGLQALNRAL